MNDTILIVDRDVTAQKTMADCLERNGHRVLTCPNLEAAQRELSQRVPELVLCDLPAPEIRQLAAYTQQHPHATSIVAVSHPEKPEHVVEALRAGASDFVIKPLTDLDLLEAAVGRQLGQVRMHRSNQRDRQVVEGVNQKLQSNLEALRADQKAGHYLQQKLFPKRKVCYNGIQFDRLIKPSLYLTGDFLDYFRIDERYVVFYLADVSGHGASSAFVTVLLKNLSSRMQRNLKRRSNEKLRSPQRLLKRVNRELLETGLDKHLTMFAGLLDMSTRMLTYSLGAHLPMPILKVGNKTEYLSGNGMPVGLFDSVEFATYQVELPPGFSLALFSDGILEVLKSTTVAGKEEELLDAVANADMSIEGFEKTFGLAGISELPDDIAIMTITESVNNDVQL